MLRICLQCGRPGFNLWVRKTPLEKGLATHSSIFVWRIPWREQPDQLQSMGLQRVGHDWETNTFFVKKINVISIIFFNLRISSFPSLSSFFYFLPLWGNHLRNSEILGGKERLNQMQWNQGNSVMETVAANPEKKFICVLWALGQWVMRLLFHAKLFLTLLWPHGL